MTKHVALGLGIAALLASSVAVAKPPAPARDHVTVIHTVIVKGRAARPMAVQEIARVSWPFSSDKDGPTLVGRIGTAVRRSPF